jgi:DNA-binding transcriptional MerR regulator
MSSFISRFGGNTQTMAHTGLASVNRALAAGLTINQIRDQLAREGVQPGSAAASFLASRPASSFISQYGGNASTFAHSGLSSVNRAIASGMSIKQIQDQAAREGVTFGSSAQNFFRNEQQKSQQQATLNTQLSGLQSELGTLRTQMQEERDAASRRMEELQGSFAQSLAAQGREKSRVESVRFADRGTGGATQKQLQRRGLRGTFGRGGERLMKISSLNV